MIIERKPNGEATVKPDVLIDLMKSQGQYPFLIGRNFNDSGETTSFALIFDSGEGSCVVMVSPGQLFVLLGEMAKKHMEEVNRTMPEAAVKAVTVTMQNQAKEELARRKRRKKGENEHGGNNASTGNS